MKIISPYHKEMLSIGNVVNLHNTLNFDIDLPDEAVEKLCERMKESGVASKKPEKKEYTFFDTPNYGNFDVTKLAECGKHLDKMSVGYHYRCRISNIEANRDKIDRDSRAKKVWNNTYGRIKRRLNESHNWVIVKLHSIDRFGRITVSLYDIITGYPYIQEYLCDKTDVFKRYNSQK